VRGGDNEPGNSDDEFFCLRVYGEVSFSSHATNILKAGKLMLIKRVKSDK
jgi:hypothetical protein